jgi:hypothetical protein
VSILSGIRRGRFVRGCLALAVAVCCCPLVRPAVADVPPADAPRLVVPGRGVLRSGQRVELRWEGRLADVEELEIMLTIEGPARRTLQISPELDPARGVFVWRVPELGRAAGRFRVRYHLDGHEVEGRPSMRYELLSALVAPLEPVLLPEAAASGLPQPPGRAASAHRGAGEPDTEAGWRERARRASLVASGPAESDVSVSAPTTTSRIHTRPQFVPARN